MAILRVWTKYASASGVGNLDGTREYMLVKGVETDSYAVGVMEVGNAPGIAHKGDHYVHVAEEDLGALCINVAPRQVDARFWDVTENYSSKHDDPQRNQQNPLFRPVKRSWSGARQNWTPTQDLDGKAFVNSARQPYEADRATITEAIQIYRFVRSEPYFNSLMASEYLDAINDDPWYGWGPGHCKSWISAEEQWESGSSYVNVTYEIECSARGYSRDLVDAGAFYFLDLNKDGKGDVDNPKAKRYPPDGAGIAGTSEVLLDGKGNLLPANGVQVINKFRIYFKKPFAALNL